MSKNTPQKYDIAIIGAGSAGLTMAAVSANLGYKVALFEKHKMGGDCLNTGCVPSKALLHIAAKKHAGANISFTQALQHVQTTINHIAEHDSPERFESFGAIVIQQAAQFISPTTLQTPDGQTYTARRIIIATGSRAAIVPIKGIPDVPYLTNETIFNFKEQPKHLAIIGGGPIGLEMAQAFAHLGSKVTVYEAAPTIMPRDDADAAQILHHTLTNLGVTIHTSAKIESIEKTKTGLKINAAEQTSEATHLLMATGRTPNSQNLGLETANIQTDNRGFIKTTNPSHRTHNKRVYAIGDVTGGAQFTHMAGQEAATVIQRILFGNLTAKTPQHIIPWVTYTTPEVAQVGLTQAAAKEKYGQKLQTIRVNGTEVDRFVAEGIAAAQNTFLKVMLVNGKPVGATGVGTGAGEWLAPWCLLIANNQKISALAKAIAPYPTKWEINKKAVSAYYKPTLYNKKTATLSRLLFRFFG